MSDVAEAQFLGRFTFTRQSSAEPVDLAGGVPMPLCVSERFEPPRGPCAQVSIAALTVGNDGAVLLGADQSRRRVGAQLTERQADRAGEVFVLELLLGQNLDDRRAL